jgi:hypothetical protein
MTTIPAVTQHGLPDRIEFRIGGELFTSYVFGDPKAERPYFYPLLAPTGENLTRKFPMETGDANEPTDHPHHRSLWSGHGDMNGHDNWNARPAHGWTRFRRLEETGSPDTLVAHSDCTDHDGNLLGHETLAVKIVPLADGARLIDWRVMLTAPENAGLKLGDTKEAGLVAVRVAAPLQGDRGGKIENAEGLVGEGDAWGKPSRWCDYSGKLTPEGETVGVAVLSHPGGYGHPTHWHVRGYGLFSANPFGLSAFTKGAENGTVTLAPGESLVFHYAVVVHAGDASAANIEAIWQEWQATE